MKYASSLVLNIITALVNLCRPGGFRSVIAENVALRQKLLLLKRSHRRAPKLKPYERTPLGALVALISNKRLARIAIIIKPSTIINFHNSLVKRKYSVLFSKKSKNKPGPKGPSKEIIDAIVTMKLKNPRFGYLRIAMQLSNAFGIDFNKDVVRRVLADYYKPNNNDDNDGPSWLSFLANSRDSLWSMDFFKVESITLTSYWVMVVMDQFSSKIVGFAVNCGDISGCDLCIMFNSIRSNEAAPKKLSTDNAPLYNFTQWQANLRILEIEHIKSWPYTPISHPYVERLIQTVRHEYLDKLIIWNKRDLLKKLERFRDYYNDKRCHYSLEYSTPEQKYTHQNQKLISISKFKWEKHCNGLFELPIAA